MPTVPAKYRQLIQFPVGYYRFHKDVNLNFEMNRWVSWLGESAVRDMRSVAPKIANYADWKREMLALARKTLSEGQMLNAAVYFRAAEFFMMAGDPDKLPTYERFVQMVRDYYGISESDLHLIPYENGYLPAYRFHRDNPKGVLVWFGGFDSYIEELFPIIFAFRDAGYEVVAFEGPGQGGALVKYGLPMTHEWEKPVKAVLDYFKLDDVTLAGFSLGGGLVIRAAAFEPRARRVIADDICFDFHAALLHTRPPALRTGLKFLLAVRAARIINTLLYGLMKKDLQVEWGVQQGMHVMGAATPYDFLRKAQRFTTADVSSLVKQDVLLLAGSEDHGIPLRQFYQQIEALESVRSLTARLFTRAEHAQNHCQIGNVGLSLAVILNWLDSYADRSDAQQGLADQGGEVTQTSRAVTEEQPLMTPGDALIGVDSLRNSTKRISLFS